MATGNPLSTEGLMGQSWNINEHHRTKSRIVHCHVWHSQSPSISAYLFGWTCFLFEDPSARTDDAIAGWERGSSTIIGSVLVRLHEAETARCQGRRHGPINSLGSARIHDILWGQFAGAMRTNKRTINIWLVVWNIWIIFRFIYGITG